MLAVAMIRQLQLEGTDALGTENLLNPTSSSFSPTAATATTTTTPPHLSRQRIAEMAATAMESSTSTGSSNSMTPPLHRPLDGPPLTLAPPPLLNPKRDRPSESAHTRHVIITTTLLLARLCRGALKRQPGCLSLYSGFTAHVGML